MPKLDGVVTGFQYQPDCGFWMRDEPLLPIHSGEPCAWSDGLCTVHRDLQAVTMDDDGIFVVPAEPGVDAATFRDLGAAAFNKPIFHGARGQHRGITTNMVDRVGPSGDIWETGHSGPPITWVLVGRLGALEWERSAFTKRPTEEQLERELGIRGGKSVRPRPGVPDDITYELRATLALLFDPISNPTGFG